MWRMPFKFPFEGERIKESLIENKMSLNENHGRHVKLSDIQKTESLKRTTEFPCEIKKGF